MALKRLIVAIRVGRAGRVSVIYPDIAKTFVKASKWNDKINKDDKMQEYLIKDQIKWKFNLSRAPCLGGQFERMVELVKQSLFKTTRRANLTKQMLEEILLDIDIVLNNRPLIYIEDDIEILCYMGNL